MEGARRRWVGPAFVAAAWLVLGADARAQSLERARGLYLDADFEAALSQFEGVLERPGLTPDDASEAHRYLSSLRWVLGDKAAAEAHARAALALDPAVAPAQGASKQLAKLFDRLREETRGTAATLTIEALGPYEAEKSLSVAATLDPAPEALAATLTLRCVSGSLDPVEERSAPPRVELTMPEVAEEVNCTASAITAAKAPLFTSSQRFGPDGAGTLSLAGPGEDDGGSVWPWIAVGGVVVAGAAVAAVLLLTSSSGSDDVKLGVEVEGWDTP